MWAELLIEFYFDFMSFGYIETLFVIFCRPSFTKFSSSSTFRWFVYNAGRCLRCMNWIYSASRGIFNFSNQNSSNFFNLKLSRMPHKSSISSTRGRVEQYNKLRSLTLLTLLIPIWFFILIILFWKEKETWSHEKNSIRTIIEFLSMTKMWISSLN